MRTCSFGEKTDLEETMTHTEKCDLFFWITLFALVIFCPILVGVGTWWTFGPETFWQRVVAVMLGITFSGASLIPLGFIMYELNEAFDRWLIQRQEKRRS
jgi:formate/nitrite transporter FocA (FNT family)